MSITDTDRLNWVLRNGATLQDSGEWVSFQLRRNGPLEEWKRQKAIKIIDAGIEMELGQERQGG